MAFRFRRRRPRIDAPRLRGRNESDAIRVEFTDFHPDTSSFLGQVAYLQLSVFDMLSALCPHIDDLALAPRVASAASVAMRKHEQLTAEIRRREEDPALAMEEPREAVRLFRQSIQGETLEERVLSAYVTVGLLDDLFLGLASSLPQDVSRRVTSILAADNERDVLREFLQARIEEAPGKASMLALWGRRLVGDTLLLAHEVLPFDNGASDEHIEPVFTELIAAHTRRMDSLGLTA